jgi:hypothetical protein
VRGLAGLFRIGFQLGEEVSARLEAMERDPGKIDLIIDSHFHFDHVDGNALIPNATMLVQGREWEAGMDADAAVRRGFNRRDFDSAINCGSSMGEHDVFGDGSVVCLPTHGHTTGHQSLRLRLDHGEIALAPDACHFCQTLRERRLPRNMYDREAVLTSLPVGGVGTERGSHVLRPRSGVLANSTAGTGPGRTMQTRNPIRLRSTSPSAAVSRTAIEVKVLVGLAISRSVSYETSSLEKDYEAARVTRR